MLQYDLYHCTPVRLLMYLTTFAKQQFKGNYNSLRSESHITEFKGRLEQIVLEIGDISMFLLLSSIRLDAFTDRGFHRGFDLSKNPYNILCDPEVTPKLIQFFKLIRNGTEAIPEHFGPVLLSWICALHWGLAFPDQCTLLRSVRDTEELGELQPSFSSWSSSVR